MNSGEYKRLILETKFKHYIEQEFGPKFMKVYDVNDILEQKVFQKLTYKFIKNKKSIVFYCYAQGNETIKIIHFFDHLLSEVIFDIRTTEEIETIFTLLDDKMKQYRLKKMYD